MKLSHYLHAMIVLLVTLSCNSNTGKESSKPNVENPAATAPKPLVFDQLVGTWQSEDGKSFERWIRKENGHYEAVGFSIKGKDTSWNEQASVYPENDAWVFENKVKGQNNGGAVKFVSGVVSENAVQFSNPAHDFPTDINYSMPDANTIRAFIVGPNGKGGKDTIPFNFSRIK